MIDLIRKHVKTALASVIALAVGALALLADVVPYLKGILEAL